MLKITIVDAPQEQKLVLEGRLIEPDLAELESTWRKARTALGTRKCVVDLRNATFIDENAERILLDMQREGAQFIAYGVFTRHQLEQLGIKCEGDAPKVRA
jgi:anti-anti-sigma regulatory factor